jgi:20S proteasome alpha/beta subunit
MTLVIAAKGPDYVVVGADSRSTIKTRDYSQGVDMAEKIIPLTKHVVVLLFGAGETATYLAQKFVRKLEKGKTKLDGASNVADKFAEFCRAEFKASDISIPSFPYFGFIVAGLDLERGKYRGPRCYILRSNHYFMVGESTPFVIDGRPFIAMYKFERELRDVKSYNDLCCLVAQSIYDTRAVDGTVGGRITIGIIDSERVRLYSGFEVKRMIKPWEDESR